jgi:hypothetical protein
MTLYSDPNAAHVQDLVAEIERKAGCPDTIQLGQAFSSLTGKLRCTATIHGDRDEDDMPEHEGWGATYTGALGQLAESLGVTVDRDEVAA